MANPLAAAGDAMETLKMKIFMLKKENTDVSEKMEAAENVKKYKILIIENSFFLTFKFLG